MKLRSEVLSNVMRIMLTILIAVAVLDFIGSLIYGFSETFYMDSGYSLFSMVSIITAVLYAIICIVYLIWVWYVHVDFNRLLDQYPRTPGEALAGMIIPFYSFYGLPSTYNRMGRRLVMLDVTAAQGHRITNLVSPLISLVILHYLAGRVTSNISDNAVVFIVVSAVSLAFYTVCLLMTRAVSQSLTLLANSQAPANAETSQQQNVLSH